MFMVFAQQERVLLVLQMVINKRVLFEVCPAELTVSLPLRVLYKRLVAEGLDPFDRLTFFTYY